MFIGESFFFLMALLLYKAVEAMGIIIVQ